jgi:hypothetical protein
MAGGQIAKENNFCKRQNGQYRDIDIFVIIALDFAMNA